MTELTPALKLCGAVLNPLLRKRGTLKKLYSPLLFLREGAEG